MPARQLRYTDQGGNFVELFDASNAAAATYASKALSATMPARGNVTAIQESSNTVGGLYRKLEHETKMEVSLAVVTGAGTTDIEFLGIDKELNHAQLIFKGRFTTSTLAWSPTTTHPFTGATISATTFLFLDEIDTITNGVNMMPSGWDTLTTWAGDDLENRLLIDLTPWSAILAVVTNLTTTSRCIAFARNYSD